MFTPHRRHESHERRASRTVSVNPGFFSLPLIFPYRVALLVAGALVRLACTCAGRVATHSSVDHTLVYWGRERKSASEHEFHQKDCNMVVRNCISPSSTVLALRSQSILRRRPDIGSEILCRSTATTRQLTVAEPKEFVHL